jgi:hypothetical protein
VSGEPTLGEVWRTFEDFRRETRDQYKFVIRLLIGTLVSAVLGNLAAAAVVVLFK